MRAAQGLVGELMGVGTWHTGSSQAARTIADNFSEALACSLRKCLPHKWLMQNMASTIPCKVSAPSTALYTPPEMIPHTSRHN